MKRQHTSATPFPYTTLFRSAHGRVLKTRGESLQGGQIARQEIIAETVAAVLCILMDVETEAIAVSRDYVKQDRKSTRLNSSHTVISYAVFCLKKKKYKKQQL